MNFYTSYFTPYKGEIKTLKLKQDPVKRGLGLYKDVEGNTWDVRSIKTNDKARIINARRVDKHPSYYGTHKGAISAGHHKWIPYRYEVI